MSKPSSTSYSNKFYNVKIMRTYVAYLTEKCLWPMEKIELLLELTGCDITFLDSEDNWFDQELADHFQENIQKMTGDKTIAYKVGRYAFSTYAKGIFGRLLQGFASPKIIFRNIGKNSSAYSRGAVIRPVCVTSTTAVLRSTPVEGCDEKSYQCLNRKGMLEAIPPFLGCKNTKTIESKCVHLGDPYCEYLIEWKTVLRFPRFAVVIGTGFASFWVTLLTTRQPLLSLIVGAGSGLLTSLYHFVHTIKDFQKLVSEKDNALEESVRIFNRRYEENALKQNVILNTFRSASLDELCINTATTLQTNMRFDRVLIMLEDPEHNVLRTKAALGFKGHLKEIVEMAEFKIDPGNIQGFFISVFNSGKPLFLRDVHKKMDRISARSRQLLKLLETKAFIVVPIISLGKSVGVMAVENLEDSRPLVNDDMDTLMEIAKLMGFIIPNIKNMITIKKAEQLAKSMEEQERSLRETFQKFIPGEAVSRLRQYGGEYLTIQKKTLDVLFVDIVGFTRFSETIPPEEVADILNIYIDEIHNTVERYRGRINKIIGDGLLIYFDPTGPNSIRAGYAILLARAIINRRLEAKGYGPISLGVGAHRGVCTIGYIGTKDRLDYTLIGDTVNVAARIESHTRQIGPNTFCFSGEMIEDAINDFNCISQGEVTLKGRQKSVEMFQLLNRLKNRKVGPLRAVSKLAEEGELELAGRLDESFRGQKLPLVFWNN